MGIHRLRESGLAPYLMDDLNESFEKNPKMFVNELNYLVCKLLRGEISPKVAGRVSLNQVPKAQTLIEKGLPNGTVVCLPWKKLDPKQKVEVEQKELLRGPKPFTMTNWN